MNNVDLKSIKSRKYLLKMKKKRKMKILLYLITKFL